MGPVLVKERLNKYLTCFAYPNLRERIDGSIVNKLGTKIGTVNNIVDFEKAIEKAKKDHLITDDALVACFTLDGNRKLTAQASRRYLTR